METAVEREIGMIDAGKHCNYCRQLDFLPFHCFLCQQDFCSEHRFKEDHDCVMLTVRQEPIVKDTKTGQSHKTKKKTYFDTLLPEKSDQRLKNAKKEVTQPSITVGKIQPTSGSHIIQVTCYYRNDDGRRKKIHTSLSTIWPVSRALDHLVKEISRTGGNNNHLTTNKTSLRLLLGKTQPLNPNDRVAACLSNNDTLHINKKPHPTSGT